MSGNRPITIDDSVKLLQLFTGWLSKPLDPTRDTDLRNNLKLIISNIGGICDNIVIGVATPLPQSLTTKKNQPLQITFKSTNPRGEYITYLSISEPTKGKISNFDGIGGTCVYTPDTDVNDTTDSFIYGINVNGTNSDKTATISITINDGIINPPPPPGGTIGPDGVVELYKSNPNPKAEAFYIDIDNPDKDNNLFACRYNGDIVKFNPSKTEGNIKFTSNPGHKQTYASGAAPGKSCRFHIWADDLDDKPGKFSWKDKTIPIFLRSEKCFYSSEITAIVRPGKALGTHQSFAFKMNSRPDVPDDTLRSTIEFCMNNDQKKVPYVNYNYAHAGYESTSGVKVFTDEGKITVNQWIGVKNIFIIQGEPGKAKSTLMQLWVNTNPITADGKPNNDGWIKKAEYSAVGISQYKNIPPIWGGNSYLRIDGYDGVDVFRFSQREITGDMNTTTTAATTTMFSFDKNIEEGIEVEPVFTRFEDVESVDETQDYDDHPNVVKAEYYDEVL